MKKSALAVLMAGLCMFGVCGCQNSRDIEDNHFIMTMGIEKGENKLFKFIYELADVSDKAKDGGENSIPVLVYEADTFEEAEKLNEIQSNKILDYGHLKVIILSEEVMKEKEIRQKLIEQLERKDSIAGTTLLMFTRENIEEIIKKCSENGVSCGEYLEMLETNRKKKEKQKKTLASALRDYSEGKRKIEVTILRKDEGIKIWDGIMNIKEETEFQIYYDSVLRFHIRANSDSEKDQAVKNLIKDDVLVKIQDILKGCDTKDSCVTTIKENQKMITAWVSEACEKYQNDYKGEVYLVREVFPLKVYGDSVVPSGIYDALRINLGEGKGANWWCMMYPELCLSDGVIEGIAKEEKKPKNNNSENSVTYKGKRKYHIRWRIMELLRDRWKK